jgi:uncharacterized protein YjiS (DUF1127 family)
MRYRGVGNDRPRWLGWAGRIIGYVWGAYWDWRTRRVMLLLLQSLDARTLKDIGVTPGEVSSFQDGRELTSKEAGRFGSAPTTLVGTSREYGL